MIPLRLNLGWLRRTDEAIDQVLADMPIGDPPAEPATVAAPSYPLEQWDEDCFAAFGEGRDPSPCPDCGRTGFYGPRIDATDRRYRQCRFCGFTQMVDEDATRYQPTVHTCEAWPECARAPYIWWVPSDVTSFLCPFCHARLPVETVRVVGPVQDRKHPWWRVPQGRSRPYYMRFWENWAVTKGRVHL